MLEVRKKSMVTTTAEEQFIKYTGKAGDVSRQLALAGIALIWLLHGQTITDPLKANLNWAFWCITISITVDVMQYIIGSAMWGINIKEQSALNCKWTMVILVSLIFVKLIAMFLGYVGILVFLLGCGFLN